MMSKSLRGVLWGLGICVILGLGAANLFMGDLNQDEGWYLYAGRLVSEGQLPYVDFAYTQGPVMPLVYAVAQPLVALWGVGGGRLFTWIMGFLAALLAAACAARLVKEPLKKEAALLAFLLIALNVYHSYFTTVVKTYALSALFIMAGFWLLTFARGRRGLLAVTAAGVALALAGGVRISAIMILPCVGAWLMMKQSQRPWHWVWFGIGAGLMLLVLYLPFLIMAPDGILFGLWYYHAGRHVGSIVTWGVYRAAFLSRLAQGYLPAIALLLWILISRRNTVFTMNSQEQENDGGALRGVIWVCLLVVTLIHALAPMPYDDYQVMIYPLFAAVLAAAALQWISVEGGLRQLILMVTLAGLVVVGASPINQEWFSRGRDRIWWRLKDKPALLTLREAARDVRALAGPGKELLTQDIYIAVEAGLKVPPGMELGPFCYYPDWPKAKAERLHVLNEEMMLALLSSSAAPVAAFSGYGLCIRSPEVSELSLAEQNKLRAALEQRYIPVKRIPSFGQALTELVIYSSRP